MESAGLFQRQLEADLTVMHYESSEYKEMVSNPASRFPGCVEASLVLLD